MTLNVVIRSNFPLYLMFKLNHCFYNTLFDNFASPFQIPNQKETNRNCPFISVIRTPNQNLVSKPTDEVEEGAQAS